MNAPCVRAVARQRKRGSADLQNQAKRAKPSALDADSMCRQALETLADGLEQLARYRGCCCCRPFCTLR